MPGYIHTCSNCSAHMQVHERYLGRTLRCTSCRTEFLAELPADVGTVEESAPLSEDVPQRPSRKRFLPWLLLLIPFIAVVWWLGQDRSGGVGDSLFRPSRSVGEIGNLGTDGDGPVAAALDYDNVSVLVRAGSQPDPALMGSLFKDGRCLQLSPGTQVRVLERTDRGQAARVRVLNGPWSTRIVWVPTDWVR